MSWNSFKVKFVSSFCVGIAEKGFETHPPLAKTPCKILIYFVCTYFNPELGSLEQGFY
jgi:hypothetical protein